MGNQDLEELVLKIGVEVEDESLKRLRDQVKKLQEDGQKNAIKLGYSLSNEFVGPQRPEVSGFSSQSMAGANNYSKEILAALTLSEKYLYEILNINKSDHEKKQRKTDSEKKIEAEEARDLFPFVNDVSNLNKGGLAGGILGGGAGAAFGFGGGAAGGAQQGAAYGGLIYKILGSLKDVFEGVSKKFESQLNENLQFDIIRRQTGMTSEQIYKLGQQAKIAGSSLQEIIDSNQSLANELIGGISPEKAQLTMALNIDPQELLIKSNGDVAKLKQMWFERTQKALEGANPAFKTAYLNIAGFSAEEANARNYLYRPENKKAAQALLNQATLNNKVPFRNPEENFQDRTQYYAAQQKAAAAARAGLTAGGVAKGVAIDTMEVEAGIVNIGATTVNFLGEKGAEFNSQLQKTRDAYNNAGNRPINDVKNTNPSYYPSHIQNNSNAVSHGSMVKSTGAQ